MDTAISSSNSNLLKDLKPKMEKTSTGVSRALKYCMEAFTLLTVLAKAGKSHVCTAIFFPFLYKRMSRWFFFSMLCWVSVRMN